MSTINEALQNEAIRKEAWVLLNFPPSLKLPSMSSSLLYGDVSTAVHLPNFKRIFISSDAPQVWVDFYNCALESLGEQSSTVPVVVLNYILMSLLSY